MSEKTRGGKRAGDNEMIVKRRGGKRERERVRI